MSHVKLAEKIRAAAFFVWDFVVGDDWRLALGVTAGLGFTALLAGSGVVAWWLLPVLTGALLTLSVWRASQPGN
jgi:hypothetical protein